MPAASAAAASSDWADPAGVSSPRNRSNGALISRQSSSRHSRRTRVIVRHQVNPQEDNMPEPHLASKELRELRKRFKRGYTLESAGRDSRLRVLDPDGKPVHRNGSSAPLLIHSTPLGTGWRHIEKDLATAGVLKRQQAPLSDEAKKNRQEA